jgi:predicted Zn-dependent protease
MRTRPPRLAIRPALLLGLLALLGACETSINPATGRREVLLLSTADEREIDARASDQIEAQMGLVRNEQLARYVESVGQRVAVHSPRQDVVYSFSIVEMEEPNAFALPGGHIYVSRGLLLVTNTEAELANVLGHEVAHVAARHAARQDAHVKTLGIASLLSDIMSGGAEEQPDSERISGHFAARYARNQEREADRIGQDIAISAGVDPLGMPRFLSTLDNLTKLQYGGSQTQGYFASHPAVPERVAEATTSAHARSWRTAGKVGTTRASPQTGNERDAYLDRIEGMLAQRPAGEGVFDGDRFLHPDMGFSLRFPPGWEHINESAQVIAFAPRRDGVVMLQLEGPGDDPAAAARSFASDQALELDRPQSLKINGLAAHRGQALLDTSVGRIAAEITWVAHEGTVYRLIAGMEPGAMPKYRALFRRFAHSFRPLREADRAGIEELKLRTVRALDGETLEQLGRRSGNEWGPQYTAVVNGLFVDARLFAGQRIKVALREPYRPESPMPAVELDAEP